MRAISTTNGGRPLVLLLAVAALAGTGCEQVKARREIQDGNKSYYANEYEAAVQHYEAGLAARPDLTLGWYNLGLANVALFSPGVKTPQNDKWAQGATSALREYLKRVPDDTQARDILLSTYIDSGHYEGALAWFEEALAKDPGDRQALAQLAQINAQANRFDEAIRWHKRRLEVEQTIDSKSDVLYSIGVLSWRRLNGRPEVTSTERVRIADEGLSALAQAEELRVNHQATLTYTNLLYRERALGQDAWVGRAADVASADVYHKRASDLAKGTQPAAPAAAPTASAAGR